MQSNKNVQNVWLFKHSEEPQPKFKCLLHKCPKAYVVKIGQWCSSIVEAFPWHRFVTLDNTLGLRDGRSFVCLFVSFLYVPSQQLWSWGTVSTPNHTFSWASLNKQLTSTSCTYFRLLLITKQVRVQRSWVNKSSTTPDPGYQWESY